MPSTLLSRWKSKLVSSLTPTRRQSSRHRHARKAFFESLESRKVLASLHQFVTTEHTDLAAAYSAGTGWSLSVHEEVQGSMAREDALLYVGNNSTVNRPAGSQWDFIGADAGEAFYVGTQTLTDGAMYLGASAYGVTASSVVTTNPSVESKGRQAGNAKWVKFGVVGVEHTNPDGTPGDGQFSVWFNGSFGTPTVLASTFNDGVSNPNGSGFDATDGLSADDHWWLLANGHAHYNFGFTQPGRYEVQLQLSANFTSGGVASSDPLTVYFSVGSVGQVEFDMASYTVSEDGDTATVNVQRVGGSDGQIEVGYATSAGTATAGDDYTETSGTLAFADGETTKQIVIPILNDSDAEGDETIYLTLSDPAPSTIEDFLGAYESSSLIGAQSTATLTILDDDSESTPPEFIVGLTKDHADLGIAFEDGEFDLHVHVRGEEHEHEGEEEEEHAGFEYAPSEVLIQLGPSSAAAAPSDPNYAFLGVAGGSTIHLLSSIEDPSLPFLGIATEEIEEGVFLNDELTLALKSVSGPGLYSLWSTDEFGVPTPHMTSSNGVDGSDFIVLGVGEHSHFDMAFTEAGVYEVTLEAFATLADGVTVVSSGEVTYYFSVNMGLAPHISLAESELIYAEQAAAKIVDTTASVVDADSTDFDGGQLRIDIAEGGQAEDVLSILHQGNGVNQIGVIGNQITLGIAGGGTVLLGTFSGGADDEPLVIELTAEATAARITRLMRRVAFYNGSDNPTDAERAIRFVVADGDGEISDAAIRHVAVKPVNDKPVVVASGNVVNYTENGAPVVIDPSIVVSDVDSPDFDLGKLTVRVASGGQSTDRFGIDASGLITVAGNAVSYDGTPIGSFAGTTTLNVTFNSNATPEIVQELARRITYFSISEGPSTTPRQISFTVNDGDKGTSAAALGNIVQVFGENDAPVLTLSNATAAKYIENGAAALISSAATVVDVDLLDFDGGVLTVAITGNATADDLLSIQHVAPAHAKVSVDFELGKIYYTTTALGTYEVATFSGGDGVNPLMITFNSDALKTEVQAVFKAITFANSSENPSTAPRTVSFTLTDGDGGTSNTVVRSVNVTAKNDAPVVAEFGPGVDYVLGGSPTLLTDSAFISDVDSANFLGGVLTVALTTGKNSLDRVEIQEGNGISVNDNVVSFNGNAIGTFAGTTTLSVSLNAAFATPDAAQALLRQLSFRTTATTTRAVTVTARVTDGDGGTSAIVSKTIDVLNPAI